MQFKRIQEMLDNIGLGNPRIDGVARSSESEWFVAFEEEIAAVVEWAESPPRLVFSAPVGRPPVDRRFVVYESLLSFNALWRDGAGCRLGLNGGDGEVVALLDVFADDLTPASLEEALYEFSRLALQWRAYVEAAPQALSLPPPHPMLLAGLRA
ncbi:MAG: type III secretion system chaperone [Pseudomonadota bacterium]